MTDEQVVLEYAARIRKQIGCPQYRAEILAKRELGLIPERTGANGAKSGYYTFDPQRDRFDIPPEQAALRKEFTERFRR